MEHKVIRIIGPAAKLDSITKQLEVLPDIRVQEFTIDDFADELRLNTLLWQLQKAHQARQAAHEFDHEALKMLRKAGIL